MNCRQVQESLIFRIKGELTEKMSADMDRHLETCHSCSYLYNEMQASLKLMHEEQTGMNNPFFFTRVEQRLMDLKSRQREPMPVLLRILKPASLALLIVIACFVGWLIGASLPSSETYPATGSAEISQIADQYQLNLSQEDAIENYYVNQ